MKQYADLVRQNFNVRKIILYGSYSRDAARKDSDIDVAVVLDSVNEDFLMCEARLFRLRRKINARIEPVLTDKPMGKVVGEPYRGKPDVRSDEGTKGRKVWKSD